MVLTQNVSPHFSMHRTGNWNNIRVLEIESVGWFGEWHPGSPAAAAGRCRGREFEFIAWARNGSFCRGMK
jgi:hypothetical protein